ncbi:glycosyltransferase [Larkinella ripae]
MNDTTSIDIQKIYILLPLFEDWEALELLLKKISKTVEAAILQRLHFLIIDDCSAKNFTTPPADVGQSLSILRLYRNVGHQKAIAIGLSYLADQPEQHITIVMDSDGEDQPEDIGRFLKASLEQPGQIIFARRTKRQESWVFRSSYWAYKLVFKILTGKVITFGNFSLIPPELLKKLVHVSDIWNNYPGGIIRSRLPYTSIPIERGARLAGQSKMNFTSLVLHGLSAISVLIDTTAVRILLFCISAVTIFIAVLITVVFLHLVEEITVPGWVNYVALTFFVVLLQALLISLLLIFIVLTYRTKLHFIPAKQFGDFVERLERVHGKPA